MTSAKDFAAGAGSWTQQACARVDPLPVKVMPPSCLLLARKFQAHTRARVEKVASSCGGLVQLLNLPC